VPTLSKATIFRRAIYRLKFKAEVEGYFGFCISRIGVQERKREGTGN
jgi:hypothetical protein